MQAISELVHTHPWAFWVGIGLLAAIIEVALPSFSFVFFSFGAAFAALTALRFSLPIQIAVFAITGLAGLVLFRARLLKLRTPRSTMPSRAGELVGRKGVVTEAIGIADRLGRVSVSGHDWAAQADKELPVGTSVIVKGSDGIVLQVKEG